MNSAGVCPGCGAPLQGMESRCPHCGRDFPAARSALAPPIQNAGASSKPPEGQCPNCGLQLPRFQPVCPNCGASVTPLQGPVWPPPAGFAGPSFYPAPPSPGPKLITGSKAADGALGFLFTLGSLFLAGIGILAIPITYLAIHRKYRAFSAGMGYGVLVALLVVLGAIVACFGSLKNL